MDIESYISSGILERYVLNEVSPQEKQEVECMSHIYPEILEEVQSLQDNIESLAKSVARPVPNRVKSDLMDKIKSIPQEVNVSKGKVVSIQKERSFPMMKIAAAILFLISASFITLFIQSENQNSQLISKVESQTKFTDSLQIANNVSKSILNHISNPSTKEVALNGTENFLKESAKVFWNSNTKEVYAILEGLTALPKDQQYQLWALIDGVPVDMGAYDNEKVYFEKDRIENAMAFAITIEKRGGVTSPTLSNMVVYGEI